MNRDYPQGESIESQLNRGRLDGLTPYDVASESDCAARAGRDRTTLRSWWLHHRCPACAHTFRLADDVAWTADRIVRHASPELPCAGLHGVSKDSDSEQIRIEFFRGLTDAWPVLESVPLIRLAAGDPLLAPPRAGLPRAVCRVCAHTFRPGDVVVRCPCSPEAPRCAVAVHRDLVRGLHCWDEWRKGHKPNETPHCLGMS